MEFEVKKGYTDQQAACKDCYFYNKDCSEHPDFPKYYLDKYTDGTTLCKSEGGEALKEINNIDVYDIY